MFLVENFIHFWYIKDKFYIAVDALIYNALLNPSAIE
jgi:hypothetical protein